jgi:predicted Zn finger-like uncharacterized protein
MNVTCTGCPAKYAVPDEKVRGKKVRITCKHCGTNIVVDGSALAADQSVLPKPATGLGPSNAPDGPSVVPAPVSASPVATSTAAPEPTFVVGFLDDRQEQHTLTQIVEMYRSGEIDDEALVWKDGMADWLSPFDVPEVATAMLKRGVTRNSVKAEPPAADEDQTLIGRSPLEDQELAAAAPGPLIAPAPVLAAALAPSAFGGSNSVAQRGFPAATQPVSRSVSPPPVVTAPLEAAATTTPVPKAAAARRSEPRGGAVDLFGNVAEAGGENDSSLDFGAAAADEPAHKLTGARNESSVLFSLDALTKSDTKPNQKQKERDKEREASAALFGESAPNSLMNVGGGGLSALAAPDFTKPVSATVEPLHSSTAREVYDTTPPNKKKGGWVLLLGSLFGIAAVAGGAFVMMKKQPLAPPAPTASVDMAAAPKTESTAPTATAGLEPSATAAPSAPAEASAAASASPPAAAGGAAPIAAATINKPAKKEPDAPAAATATATATPAAPSPSPDLAAFDKNAAVAALGAAAANAGGCKKPDGPTGSGKVSVTFAPSGRATATSVAGELAGTEVGGCVARLFRSAKVPPFSGDPVTVSKSFSVQ